MQQTHNRHCLSCRLQTSHPAKPSELLRPIDVLPHAWHTATSAYMTGLTRTNNGHNANVVFVDKLTKYCLPY